MTRKFDPTRLYKLVKASAWLYAVPMTLYALWGFLRWEDFALETSDGLRSCVMGEASRLEFCNGIWGKSFDEFEYGIWFALITGVGVLVLLYGGTAIYKYLFPKQKSK